MPTIEQYAKQPFEARLARMALTPDELGVAIRDQSDAVLSRRPDPKNWAAKEIICHLRDTEEVFFVRFHARFAEDRQYSRSDGREALAAFRRTAEEMPGQWAARTSLWRNQVGAFSTLNGRCDW